MPGKTQRFHAVLETGHKGAAVMVPFDPELAWGTKPIQVASTAYGKGMPGHLVHATIDGHALDGWIGKRWGRCFLLVDETTCKAASLAPGDDVEVVVRPRRGAGSAPQR